MHYLYFPVRIISFSLLLVFLMISCRRPKSRVIKSPPHYSFKDVVTSKLDYSLKEISGLAWDSDKDQFLAHYDERGSLFILEKERKAIVKEYKFGKSGDYEDIAIYNKVPYILRSDGVITKIIIDSTAGTAQGIEVGAIGISGSKDFETMYADTGRKALIIICKNCHMDDKKTVSAFAFYPDSNVFDNKPVFTIDAGKIEAIWDTVSKNKTSKFQPSAAAIHPKLNKLFIISSASNQLVIADLNGNVESVSELGKKLFPQPEGLAFKNSGDMYISNEGVTSKATILGFKFIP